MKICFIYKEDYPWDVRVEKIIKTLQGAGHHVTLVCRNTKGLKRKEAEGTLTILRLPAFSKLLNVVGRFIDVPFYMNPIWFYHILISARAASAQVLIVRDLPLMPCALMVCNLMKIPTIFDMAECYPEMYKSKSMFTSGIKKLQLAIIKNHGVARIFEKLSVAMADHIFVMIEESQARLLSLGNNLSNKVSIVSNTPVLPESIKAKHHRGNNIRLLYVGFVNFTRGIDSMLGGIAEFYRNGGANGQIQFDVVGNGEEVKNLIKLSQQLKIQEYTRFHGWGSHEMVARLYEECNVGVLTYRVTPHWNSTIPNKLFDYMLHGIPVIASEVKPIKRIVEGERCGVVVKDADSASLADALKIMTNPEIRQRFSECGQRAVKEKFNWSHDGKRLIDIVNRI